mgnify:CR=1 FL=1
MGKTARKKLNTLKNLQHSLANIIWTWNTASLSRGITFVQIRNMSLSKGDKKIILKNAITLMTLKIQWFLDMAEKQTWSSSLWSGLDINKSFIRRVT